MSYSFFKISTSSACRIAALIITGAAVATAFSINKLEIGGVDMKDYINRDGEIDWVQFHCDRPELAQAYLEKGPRYLNAETPENPLAKRLFSVVTTQGIELAKQLVDYCASITQQCNTPTQQCPTNASQTSLSLEGDMSGLTMLSQILHCCTP